jgi:hypothetical protein
VFDTNSLPEPVIYVPTAKIEEMYIACRLDLRRANSQQMRSVEGVAGSQANLATPDSNLEGYDFASTGKRRRRCERPVMESVRASERF